MDAPSNLCPACHEPMRPVNAPPVQFQACPVCAGLWFGRAALAKAASEETVRAVLDASRGKLGRCKSCQTQLSSGGPCPKCKRAPPTCPDCGRAPLSVGNVNGVNLDVCSGCAGIWFDPGELLMVAGRGPSIQKLQMDAFNATTAKQGNPIPRQLTCSACGKTVSRGHAFVESDAYFCGTCCPKGAAPVVAKLTKRPVQMVDEHGHHEHSVTVDAGSVVEAALGFLRIFMK